MGIQEVFKNAAKTIFTAFGDVPRSCTYVSTGTKELNTHTGIVVTKTSDPDVSYGVDIIFTKYTKAEIDGVHILYSHVKALIPFENLTPTPKKNDTIAEDVSGEQWGVIDWKKDPADALWILQLEQIG